MIARCSMATGERGVVVQDHVLCWVRQFCMAIQVVETVGLPDVSVTGWDPGWRGIAHQLTALCWDLPGSIYCSKSYIGSQFYQLGKALLAVETNFISCVMENEQLRNSKTHSHRHWIHSLKMLYIHHVAQHHLQNHNRCLHEKCSWNGRIMVAFRMLSDNSAVWLAVASKYPLKDRQIKGRDISCDPSEGNRGDVLFTCAQTRVAFSQSTIHNNQT